MNELKIPISELYITKSKPPKGLANRWSKLRRSRVKNEAILLNCVGVHSLAAAIQYGRYLVSVFNKDFPGAIKIVKGMNGLTEKWLRKAWIGLGETQQMDGILTDQDLAYIEFNIDTNLDTYLSFLDDCVNSIEGQLKVILLGVRAMLRQIKEGKTSFRKLFMEDLDKRIEISERNVTETGKLSSRSLYAELCAGLHW